MAAKKPTAAPAKRAETLELARQLIIATISAGAIITTPQAARGFVQSAREMLDEVDNPTPIPEKAKAPTGQGRPGSTAGGGFPDDLLGELSADG